MLITVVQNITYYIFSSVSKLQLQDSNFINMLTPIVDLSESSTCRPYCNCQIHNYTKKNIFWAGFKVGQTTKSLFIKIILSTYLVHNNTLKNLEIVCVCWGRAGFKVYTVSTLKNQFIFKVIFFHNYMYPWAALYQYHFRVLEMQILDAWKSLRLLYITTVHFPF